MIFWKTFKGQKRSPLGGGNKFNSRKNREEIQFQRKSKKLTMFMSFIDIFPVFDEFLPYFSSYLSHLMFFTQFHAKYWKIFGAPRHLRLYFVQFCLKNGKFSALRAIWGFILPKFCKKRKIFGASRHFKYVMKIFNCTGVKKQGRNWHVLFPGGGKNWNFWPKYLPLFLPSWHPHIKLAP